MCDLLVSDVETSPVDALLQSIKVRGGELTKHINQGTHLLELSLPVPGRNDARVCIRKPYDKEVSSLDIMDVLYEAQHLLDSVDMPRLYEP